jgi:UDP-N-acetylmuramate dehydrogenase
VTFEIQQQSSLANLNSLGLDVAAEFLAAAHTEDEVCEALEFARSRSCPLTVLGAGSNVVLSRPIEGLVLVMCIPGVLFDGERVEAGAGENWHHLVLGSLEQGLFGLENLSLIPGSVGAAPIQNIGAYGVELESVFSSLVGIDRETLSPVELNKMDCRFGYRDSAFKHNLKDRFVITRVRLSLSDNFEPNLSYDELAREVADSGEALSAELVSETVCRIRTRKLPDPSEIGNVGSFFKNPVVPLDRLEEMQSEYPAVPHWMTTEGAKLAAAWLIEQCGLKGLRVGGASISRSHALVVVNEGSATGNDVMSLAAEVQSRVGDRFGVALEVEPIIY